MFGIKEYVDEIVPEKNGFEPSDTTVEVSMIGVLIVVVNLGNYPTPMFQIVINVLAERWSNVKNV